MEHCAIRLIPEENTRNKEQEFKVNASGSLYDLFISLFACAEKIRAVEQILFKR